MAATKGRGAFGVPTGNIWVENPDGVIRTQDNGDTPSSLYDARWVCNSGGQAFGWGSFPGDNDSAMIPMAYDEADSTGTVTDVSSPNPIGRQR